MWKLAEKFVPKKVIDSLDSYVEHMSVLGQIRDPKVMLSLLPAAVRGLLLKRGKQGAPSRMRASHDAYFDWTYPSDQPEMSELYRRAKDNQWNGERDLDWSTDVDLEHPTKVVFPTFMIDWKYASEIGMRLDEKEKRRFMNDMGAWALSQFLHGEQGALMAAAQVTEAVQFFDGTYYGATQVMDEARHVEVFSRYLDTKFGKLYQVNDNLFTIIDALMVDSRWDMKF
ncbi:MAG: hypothetical protein ACI9MR_004890, partial [Myxococcota bacterium]